jgi:hypothetical protein
MYNLNVQVHNSDDSERPLIQGVQKVTQPMEKCNINFIFYYYAYFL